MTIFNIISISISEVLLVLVIEFFTLSLMAWNTASMICKKHFHKIRRCFSIHEQRSLEISFSWKWFYTEDKNSMHSFRWWCQKITCTVSSDVKKWFCNFTLQPIVDMDQTNSFQKVLTMKCLTEVVTFERPNIYRWKIF